MKNRPAIYALICILSFSQPASADEFGNMFSLMFRMMLSMMDAMSDVFGNNSNDSGWGSGNTFNWGMTTLPMAGGMGPWSGLGGMPINSMGITPWNSPMTGNPWSNPFAGGSYPSTFPGYNRYAYQPPNSPYAAQYASSSLLNGRWFGSMGEILEIRGNQFRLQNRQSSIHGKVRIENNIVSLFLPKTGGVMQYTFVRNQSELVLQDAAGQVLVYRQQPVNRGARIF